MELTTVTCAMTVHYLLFGKIIYYTDLGNRTELIQVSLWISIYWEFLGEIKMVKNISRVKRAEVSSRMAFEQSD